MGEEKEKQWSEMKEQYEKRRSRPVLWGKRREKRGGRDLCVPSSRQSFLSRVNVHVSLTALCQAHWVGETSVSLTVVSAERYPTQKGQWVFSPFRALWIN